MLPLGLMSSSWGMEWLRAVHMWAAQACRTSKDAQLVLHIETTVEGQAEAHDQHLQPPGHTSSSRTRSRVMTECSGIDSTTSPEQN